MLSWWVHGYGSHLEQQLVIWEMDMSGKCKPKQCTSDTDFSFIKRSTELEPSKSGYRICLVEKSVFLEIPPMKYIAEEIRRPKGYEQTCVLILYESDAERWCWYQGDTFQKKKKSTEMWDNIIFWTGPLLTWHQNVWNINFCFPKIPSDDSSLMMKYGIREDKSINRIHTIPLNDGK